MLDKNGRQLIELTQVLTRCRASGPICALEALNLAGLYLTGGDDIINIGSILPGPPGPPGPPGEMDPLVLKLIEERFAMIETRLAMLEERDANDA